MKKYCFCFDEKKGDESKYNVFFAYLNLKKKLNIVEEPQK